MCRLPLITSIALVASVVAQGQTFERRLELDVLTPTMIPSAAIESGSYIGKRAYVVWGATRDESQRWVLPILVGRFADAEAATTVRITSDQARPAHAVAVSGIATRALVLWADRRDDTSGIYARLIGAGGDPISAEVLLLPMNVDSVRAIRIYRARGSFTAIVEQNSHLFSCRVDSAGALLGTAQLGRGTLDGSLRIPILPDLLVLNGETGYRLISLTDWSAHGTLPHSQLQGSFVIGSDSSLTVLCDTILERYNHYLDSTPVRSIPITGLPYNGRGAVLSGTGGDVDVTTVTTDNSSALKKIVVARTTVARNGDVIRKGELISTIVGDGGGWYYSLKALSVDRSDPNESVIDVTMTQIDHRGLDQNISTVYAAIGVSNDGIVNGRWAGVRSNRYDLDTNGGFLSVMRQPHVEHSLVVLRTDSSAYSLEVPTARVRVRRSHHSPNIFQSRGHTIVTWTNGDSSAGTHTVGRLEGDSVPSGSSIVVHQDVSREATRVDLLNRQAILSGATVNLGQSLYAEFNQRYVRWDGSSSLTMSRAVDTGFSFPVQVAGMANVPDNTTPLNRGTSTIAFDPNRNEVIYHHAGLRSSPGVIAIDSMGSLSWSQVLPIAPMQSVVPVSKSRFLSIGDTLARLIENGDITRVDTLDRQFVPSEDVVQRLLGDRILFVDRITSSRLRVRVTTTAFRAVAETTVDINASFPRAFVTQRQSDSLVVLLWATPDGVYASSMTQDLHLQTGVTRISLRATPVSSVAASFIRDSLYVIWASTVDSVSDVFLNTVALPAASRPPAVDSSAIDSPVLARNVAIISVHPQPATESIVVQLESVREVEVTAELISIDGRNSMKKTMPLYKGRQSVNLDTRDLTSGVYVLRLGRDGAFATRKIIVQHDE